MQAHPRSSKAPAHICLALLCALAALLLPWPAASAHPAEAEAAAAPTQLAYSSYLGGNSDEEGRGIARDAAGNLYVVGQTYSTDFGGSPNTIAGSSDIFVAKFDPSGKKMLYRTILGG